MDNKNKKTANLIFKGAIEGVEKNVSFLAIMLMELVALIVVGIAVSLLSLIGIPGAFLMILAIAAMIFILIMALIVAWQQSIMVGIFSTIINAFVLLMVILAL
ncbi:hypothetical protein [Weissella oryzae]|nr:hypothetical protein [Weissella oryzae]